MSGFSPSIRLHSMQRANLPFYGKTFQTAGLLHSEHGDTTIYRNVGNNAHNDIAAHRRRLSSSEKFYLFTKQSKSDCTESDIVLLALAFNWAKNSQAVRLCHGSGG
jgi:hypothetical protein